MCALKEVIPISTVYQYLNEVAMDHPMMDMLILIDGLLDDFQPVEGVYMDYVIHDDFCTPIFYKDGKPVPDFDISPEEIIGAEFKFYHADDGGSVDPMSVIPTDPEQDFAALLIHGLIELFDMSDIDRAKKREEIELLAEEMDANMPKNFHLRLAIHNRPVNADHGFAWFEDIESGFHTIPLLN
jgi:hypothetical protein